jgi:hypothetical protein
MAKKTDVRLFRHTGTGLVERVHNAKTIELMEKSETYEAISELPKEPTAKPAETKVEAPAETEVKAPADEVVKE